MSKIPCTIQGHVITRLILHNIHMFFSPCKEGDHAGYEHQKSGILEAISEFCLSYWGERLYRRIKALSEDIIVQEERKKEKRHR